MLSHFESVGRTVHVVNLDPAARDLPYEPAIDVRTLVSLDDVMEADDLRFGPNGGLVFCVEFLLANIDWLVEQLGDFSEDYLLLDAPGQIELYSHMPLMRRLVRTLEQASYRVCSVYLLDSTFLGDPARFVSGALSALSAMVRLETTHVNVLSKMDQVKERTRLARLQAARADAAAAPPDGSAPARATRKPQPFSAASVSERAFANAAAAAAGDDDDDDDDDDDKLGSGLAASRAQRTDSAFDDDGAEQHEDDAAGFGDEGWEREQYDRELEKYFFVDTMRLADDLDATTPAKMRGLNHAIGSLLDEFSLVQFVPLDISSELSVEGLVERIDTALQFDEDQEVQISKDVDEEDGAAPLSEHARFVG